MLKYLAPAVLVALLPASAAFATPAVPSLSKPAMASIQLVDLRRDDHRGHDAHRNDRGRFTPGNRYRSAPRGWRSYRARPGNWRTRGCVVVGPLWFCP
jgi:hypothetical protein